MTTTRFLLLALFAITGCAASATAEDTDGAEADIKRGSKCTEVGAVDTFAKVTADNSGVKCYDASGKYVASIGGSMNGTTSLVHVKPGTKRTFSGKGGNFVRVVGTDSGGAGDLDCFMSTDYLCAVTATANPPAAASSTVTRPPPPAPADTTKRDAAAKAKANECYTKLKDSTDIFVQGKKCCDDAYTDDAAGRGVCNAEMDRLEATFGVET